MAGSEGTRLVVDGMNVVGSRPDGWWRDRAGAIRRLVERLQSHPWPAGIHPVAVFDGSPVDVAIGPVEVRFAGGGRGAADDVIAAIVAGDARPEELTVVTSDRGLADRVRRGGAVVLSAGGLLTQLDGAAGGGGAPGATGG